MEQLTDLKFRGKFRSYQQKVLDNSEKHLADGKVHIVAAPGSGKTILGLELMIRLGSPALVLSPTLVISRQWGERFSEMYLPEGKTEDLYISYSMKDPRIITSVTYQALHFAVKKQWEKEDQNKTIYSDDEGFFTEDYSGIEIDTDFRKFDLAKFISEHNIGTICLDEAHHLRREWERSLEGFLKMLPHNVNVIALTATPPYDSAVSEWNRYLAINGEIDEEIFVPELVAQGTLCPHQDYIYFNAPTGEEYSRIGEYHKRANECARELLSSPVFADAVTIALSSFDENKSLFFQYGSENTALAIVAAHNGRVLQRRITDIIYPGHELPGFSIPMLEKAVNHVIAHPEVFSVRICNDLKDICARHRVLSHGKLRLATNEKVDKMLVSSLGKLESISKIADSEHRNLDSSLRMCILTDYIRKEYLRFIGSTERIAAMGAVPIFESLRRALPSEAKIGVLTGSLIIWPSSGIDDLAEISANYDMRLSSSPLGGTGYSVINFDGGNRNKVASVTEAFALGGVQIIVGTAALLGEGWNSPCVNSIILASFVGSYVLSNQMRGRAIRTYNQDPNKTANIWHLATIETGADEIVLYHQEDTLSLNDNDKFSSLHSEFREPDCIDYKTLKRRFSCFFGPDYDGREILSGIERVNIIKGPYQGRQIARINDLMLAKAADRELMADIWNKCISGNLSLEIVDVNAVPRVAHTLTSSRFVNALYPVISGAFTAISIRIFIMALVASSAGGLAGIVLAGSVSAILLAVTGNLIKKLWRIISPAGTIKGLARSLLVSMRQLSIIRSDNVSVDVTIDSNGSTVFCSLNGGTVREKGLFSKAINEMLSPIDNPKYIAVRKSRFHNGYNYFQSYACPSFISNAKAAGILQKQLRQFAGNFAVEYAKNEHGYWLQTICKNTSVVNILSNKGQGVMRFHRVDDSIG